MAEASIMLLLLAASLLAAPASGKPRYNWGDFPMVNLHGSVGAIARGPGRVAVHDFNYLTGTADVDLQVADGSRATVLAAVPGIGLAVGSANHSVYIYDQKALKEGGAATAELTVPPGCWKGTVQGDDGISALAPLPGGGLAAAFTCSGENYYERIGAFVYLYGESALRSGGSPYANLTVPSSVCFGGGYESPMPLLTPAFGGLAVSQYLYNASALKTGAPPYASLRPPVYPCGNVQAFVPGAGLVVGSGTDTYTPYLDIYNASGGAPYATVEARDAPLSMDVLPWGDLAVGTGDDTYMGSVSVYNASALRRGGGPYKSYPYESGNMRLMIHIQLHANSYNDGHQLVAQSHFPDQDPTLHLYDVEHFTSPAGSNAAIMI